MRLNLPPAAHGPHPRRSEGFTLAELMVAMSLFSLAVLGMVYTQLFALSQDQMVNSKSGASEQARLSFNQMTSDIRGAKLWAIGNWNGTSFVPIANGTAQQGDALQLSLTSETNQYIIYYFKTNTFELRRWHSGDPQETVIVQYLTNTMRFQAETYTGAVQTDLTHKGVINVLMQFCQYQFPITKIGPNYYYNFYQLGFRVTPHVPDGP